MTQLSLTDLLASCSSEPQAAPQNHPSEPPVFCSSDDLTLCTETPVLGSPLSNAAIIPGSSCAICSAPMLRHHPELPIWRCSADAWHRFWLSHERKPDGKKGKAVGVWLGRNRRDPGSGPGPVPEWAK